MNPEPIMLTASELMRQAKMTAHDYLLSAITDIDERLGPGYAKIHPELVGAYMQTAALDFYTAIIAQRLDELPNLTAAISGLASVMEAAA